MTSYPTDPNYPPVHPPASSLTETSEPLRNESTAAKWLGLSPRTLQSLRLRGSGPCFVQLSPRRVVYRQVDLAAWVGSRLVASTSAATAAKAGAR